MEEVHFLLTQPGHEAGRGPGRGGVPCSTELGITCSSLPGSPVLTKAGEEPQNEVAGYWMLM